MSKEPYLYDKKAPTQYRFISTGRRRIEKLVEFTPLVMTNVYNLGFGDLLPNGRFDDKANTNNGDMVKVLSTVIHIIKNFTEDKPEAKIIFSGSTKERTALYQRILKTNLTTFRKEFTISALQGPASSSIETTFEPDCKDAYLAFFIKRKT